MKQPALILQHLLPYHISCFQDENPTVVAEAAEGGLELLEMIGKTFALTSSDFKIFPRYILPEYLKLAAHKDEYVVSTLLKCMGKLAILGKRFIERGLIYNIKYTCEVAAKEDVKKDSAGSPRSMINPYSLLATYETEAQELFEALEALCLELLEKPRHTHLWSMASHLHEYKAWLNVDSPSSEARAIFQGCSR